MSTSMCISVTGNEHVLMSHFIVTPIGLYKNIEFMLISLIDYENIYEDTNFINLKKNFFFRNW